MAKKINVSTVQTYLNRIADLYGTCNDDFTTITNDYLGAAKEAWGTPTGHEAMQGISNSLNEIIKEFNSKVPQAVQETINSINPLLTQEGMTTLTDPGLVNITDTAVDWTGDANEAPVPEEMETLTSTVLTPALRRIYVNFDNMRWALNQAITEGFEGAFLNQALTTFEKNAEVVNEMMEENSASAVKMAAAEDKAIASYASNT